MARKQPDFIGSSLRDLRAMPADLRSGIGHSLDLVERGQMPGDFRPMDTVGKGTYEIRVSGADGIARCFYVARFPEAVYVLHAFVKKTQKTSNKDIQTGRTRYAEMLRKRENR
jgi:phage-related protein